MSVRWPQIQFNIKFMFALTTVISAELALFNFYPWLIPPVMVVCFFACVGAIVGALRARLFRDRLDMEAFGICGFIVGGLLGLILLFVWLVADAEWAIQFLPSCLF